MRFAKTIDAGDTGAGPNTLRSVVALYVMLTALGMFPLRGAEAFANGVLPAPMAANTLSVFLFSCGFLLLTGQFMRGAALALIALLALTRLSAMLSFGETAPGFALLHDMTLTVALVVAAGLAPLRRERRLPGALIRRETSQPTGSDCPVMRLAATRYRAFADSPDDIAALFDEALDRGNATNRS